MIPHTLTVTAFGSIRRTAVIDFDTLCSDGLFLIEGDADAGKTTLYDALHFALSGSDTEGKPLKRSASSFRSRFADDTEETRVVLTFSHGGMRYRITRSPSYVRTKMRGSGTVTVPASAELYCEDAGETVTDLAAVDRRITEILHCRDSRQTPYCLYATDSLARILTASGGDMTGMIRTAFHIDRYAALERSLKTKAEESRQRLAAFDETVVRLIKNVETPEDGERLRFEVYRKDLGRLPLVVPDIRGIILRDRERLNRLKEKIRAANEQMRDTVRTTDPDRDPRRIRKELSDAIAERDRLTLLEPQINRHRLALEADARAKPVKVHEYLYHCAKQDRAALSGHPKKAAALLASDGGKTQKELLLEYRAEEEKLHDQYLLSLQKAGFATEEEYLGARMTDAVRESLHTQIADYENRCASLDRHIIKLRKKLGSVMDHDAAKQYGALKKQLLEFEKDCRRTEQRIRGNEFMASQLEEQTVKRKNLYSLAGESEAGYRAVAGLDSGVSLEMTELGRVFGDCLRAANEALSVLTDGELSLCRAADNDPRMRDALIPELLHTRTGVRFGIASLSDSELTTVSLALNIGLCRVMQENTESEMPDMIFSDSVFAKATDDQKRRIAAVLYSFSADSGIRIGLIERTGAFGTCITNRVLVTKGSDGSTVEIRAASEK